MIALTDLDRELATRGPLHDFIRLVWPQIESSPFVDGWHLQAITEALEDVSAGKTRTLVINVPPGCTKSFTTNVAWPVWEWLRRPSTKYVYASFDQSLVGRRDGGKIVALLRSLWWRERFMPLLMAANPSTTLFEVAGGGMRFATSPGGRGTGRHGNIVVYDDPIKPRDASGGAAITHKMLTAVSEWRSNTMVTRRADPATHREVCVMQRLHKDDLAGEILRQGGAVHLRLPMRYEVSYPTVGDPRTLEGELLCPRRFPEETVTQLEAAMGPIVAAAQLQQRPHARGGNIFRRAFWRFWGTGNEPCLCDRCFDAEISAHDTGIPCTPLPEAGQDLQSWDMAFKGKQHSDFVAGGAWRAYGGRFFLLALHNARLDFADSKIAVVDMATHQPGGTTILIEGAANGPAIESELSNGLPGIELVTPLGGKEARAAAVQPLFQAHHVYLPATGALTYAFMKQAEAFPHDLHDDMVDMASQALGWYRANGATALFGDAMANVRAKK